MNVEQLVLALPGRVSALAGRELTVYQWGDILDQFAAQGGREVMLSGAEPLEYPGFWPIVRRSFKSGIGRVTACLSGSLLEPRVCRELIESGVHLLLALDSLAPDPHEALHGVGSHTRATAALERFLNGGMANRLGVLATVTRLSFRELPLLAAWAAGRGVDRFLWSHVPDGGWPSPQLQSLRLSPEEKIALAEQMATVAKSAGGRTYLSPVDPLEDPDLGTGYSRTVRVSADGEGHFGFSGVCGYLGNLKHSSLKELLNRGNQAVGD